MSRVISMIEFSNMMDFVAILPRPEGYGPVLASPGSIAI